MDSSQIWHRHSLTQSILGGKIWSWLSEVWVPMYSYRDPPTKYMGTQTFESQDQILPPIIEWVKECLCQI